MSGGHTANPGFSSTKGIHIWTRKFSQVTYDPACGTAVIGTGLIWDTVYQQLQEHGVIVLGGRATGVSRAISSAGTSSYLVTQQIGVGGLLLGGGWSLEALFRFFH